MNIIAFSTKFISNLSEVVLELRKSGSESFFNATWWLVALDNHLLIKQVLERLQW